MKRTFLIVLTIVAVTLLISMLLANANTKTNTETVYAITSTSKGKTVYSQNGNKTASLPLAKNLNVNETNLKCFSNGKLNAYASASETAYAWTGVPPVAIKKANVTSLTGYDANATGYATDPEISTDVNITVPGGITLEQSGDSSALYEISVIDMNTSETVFYAAAVLMYQQFSSWGNWSTQWTTLNVSSITPNASSIVKPPTYSNVTAIAQMGPSSVIISLPTGHMANETEIVTVTVGEAGGAAAAYTTSPVGGVVVPIDKLALLTPYIGLASTILVAAVASIVYVKHVKRREEKQ
jgi:hypothetical protein